MDEGVASSDPGGEGGATVLAFPASAFTGHRAGA